MENQPSQLQVHRQIDALFESYDARKESRKSLLGFSLVYLTGYFTDPPATFHPELLRALEREDEKRVLILGFRGSGKSTFGSLALPLWAALEYPERYPFIILVADSSRQATLNISSIKHELETNDLIKQDYGEIRGNVIELQGEGEEWQKQNIVLSNGVRILARSRGQKVRGLRHLQHRPRLIVVDDPEDGEWVRTKENRDKTDRWLKSEIMPGMDARKGKLVVIGNLLHMDALLSRLRAPGTGFKCLEFPLIDKNGVCTWPAMYPTEQSLKDKERDMGPVAWQREMLLKIVAEEGQIITPEDIHYYDEIPPMNETTNDKGEKVRIPILASLKGHGVDLAISEKESADYTAIVSGDVYYVDDTPKIYVRANPYNEHVNFHETMKHVRGIPGERGGANIFFVEDIGYQKAAVQEMERAMLPVVPMKPTTDKRSRLQVVAPYIKNGTVMFPRAGCEQLLGQLFNLGVESHDDLCLAGDTKVLTKRGEINLRDVLAGDFVMTRQGYKRVLWAGQTGEREVITRFGLTGTPDHPVITMLGIKRLDVLEQNDMVYSWNRGSIRACAASNVKPVARHSRDIRARIAQLITATARAIVAQSRTSETSANDLRETSSMKHHAESWGQASEKPIGAGGMTSQFDTRTWIGGILRRTSSTTKTYITAILNRSAALIGSITGITVGRKQSRCRFIGNYGLTTTVQPTGLPMFTTKTATRSITTCPTSMQRTSECTCPTTCGNQSESGCLAVQSGQRKQRLPHGTNLQPEENGIVNTRDDRDSARPNVVPVYNLLVEDAHEFFANGILVHNCDALVWLIQGLVEQGLDLPKIHWIEA